MSSIVIAKPLELIHTSNFIEDKYIIKKKKKISYKNEISVKKISEKSENFAEKRKNEFTKENYNPTKKIKIFEENYLIKKENNTKEKNIKKIAFFYNNETFKNLPHIRLNKFNNDIIPVLPNCLISKH